MYIFPRAASAIQTFIRQKMTEKCPTTTFSSEINLDMKISGTVEVRDIDYAQKHVNQTKQTI